MFKNTWLVSMASGDMHSMLNSLPRTHAAAAAAAPAAAEDDVDARAMRGGAAPTQGLTPLSGSSHHDEPLTAERLAGCSHL